VKSPRVPYFMQLYVFQDRETTIEMIKRAESAGYAGLILTVDAPVHGRRRNEVRNKFRLPDHMWPANFAREDFKLPMTAENESQDSFKERVLVKEKSSDAVKKQKGLNG
jgi:isopentenyl diphosphate isomerase/L-lactate dehydrogenase-like FMN-dependent dehydrogenase